VKGSIIQGPNGFDRFDMLHEEFCKTFIQELARQALDLDAFAFFDKPLDTEALEAENKKTRRYCPGISDHDVSVSAPFRLSTIGQ